jgi:hypothetical protein
MKKRKPHFQNRQKRLCCSVETGNQWGSSWSAWPEKGNQRCIKTEMRLREKQFKKQMDSKRKIEGDGFSTVKETHKTSVKGKCNDGARCCAGTPCFFCSISCNFSKCFTDMGSPISSLKMWFQKESDIQSVQNTKEKDVLLPHLGPP